jgi:hypothetical protein
MKVWERLIYRFRNRAVWFYPVTVFKEISSNSDYIVANARIMSECRIVRMCNEVVVA